MTTEIALIWTTCFIVEAINIKRTLESDKLKNMFSDPKLVSTLKKHGIEPTMFDKGIKKITNEVKKSVFLSFIGFSALYLISPIFFILRLNSSFRSIRIAIGIKRRKKLVSNIANASIAAGKKNISEDNLHYSAALFLLMEHKYLTHSSFKKHEFIHLDSDYLFYDEKDEILGGKFAKYFPIYEGTIYEFGWKIHKDEDHICIDTSKNN